jgi:hypothetical protein
MKRALILGLGALIVTAAMAAAQGKPAAAPKTGGQATVGANFVDANGDGICDNFQNGTRGANGQGPGKCCGRGRGNGMHAGPQDGTGAGAPAGAGTGRGTGTCDGTGPKGRGRGPRR